MTIPRKVGGVCLERLTSGELRRRIDALARLRIEVFRDFPYLYDGDLDYEAGYLETYLNAEESAIIAAYDEGRLVGASTCLPLKDETPDVLAPFERRGMPIDRVFYFGESVLLKPYRGQGIGVAFFEEREAWARSLGRFEMLSFCAVVRPPQHPRRPPDYVPLDAFWRRRGFDRIDDMETTFVWRDLDEAEASPKRMVFWVKTL